MSLTILSNFSYNGKNPNFDRDRVATVADLKAVKPENQEYDYGHIVFCKEDGKHYRFMYNYGAPDDANYSTTTGWFQELVTGGNGVSESTVADWGFTKNKGTVEAVDTDEEVDDVLLEYATIQYVDNAISAAITTTLNTLV